MNKLKTFLSSNTSQARLIRTIVQGLVGVIIANLDMIVGGFTIDPSQKALIVALTMAVLSPVMSYLGGGDTE